MPTKDTTYLKISVPIMEGLFTAEVEAKVDFYWGKNEYGRTWVEIDQIEEIAFVSLESAGSNTKMMVNGVYLLPQQVQALRHQVDDFTFNYKIFTQIIDGLKRCLEQREEYYR